MKINGATVLSALATTTNYVLKQSSTVGTLINSQIFDNGTNVGIGTTTPFQSKVHILKSESGSNPIPVLRIGNQGAGYTSRIVLTDETTNDANISYIGSLQSLGFGVGASLSQMIITSSGNVGIGTTSPGNLLNTFIANGAGDFGKGVRISTGNGTYTSGHGGMLEFQNEDVMTAGIRGVRQSGWGSSLLFYVHNTSAGNTFDSTFVERMRIDESGNVGIGTTSPSSNLTVVRNANNASYITNFSNTNAGASAATISEWKVNGYSSFVIGKSNSDGRVEIAQIGNNNIDFINNGTNVMSIDTNQNVMVNGTTAEACAQLEIKSETKGFLPPRMSDADRDNISSPVEGLMIYNTTQKTINFYDGTTWQRVAVV